MQRYLAMAQKTQQNFGASRIDALSQRNFIATPLLSLAYKLHYEYYTWFYPFPVQIHIKDGKISWEVDNILHAKYIPWLTTEVLVTIFLGLGSCIFLLIYSCIRPEANVGILPCAISILVGCVILLQCSIYWTCFCCNEVQPLVNQLFHIERTCKSNKYF